MKKMIASILTLILVLGTVTIAYGSGYSDIKASNWAYDSVTAMSDKAIVKGYPDGSFKPSGTVTYGEFIKMALIAATGKDAGNSTEGNWAMNYYNQALELKYFTEYDIDKSQINNQITRADMALIISSILGDVKIENYDALQKTITDITYQTDHEYDITKAYAKGILTGYTDKTFKPGKTLSRAESATVIYRLVDESKRVLPGTEIADKPETSVPLTGNVKDFISNYDSFINSGNGTVNVDWAEAKTYTITEDASKYNMVLKTNRGTNWIEVMAPEGMRQMFFVKDGKVTESLMDFPSADNKTRIAVYESDVTKVDYIASLYCSGHSVELIANPFKK